MTGKSKSILYLHLSVLLMGFAGVIIKYVSVSSAVITFGRVFFSSIVLFCVLKAKKERLKLNCRLDIYIAVFAGIIMALHWFSFMHSIRLSTVAIGTITYSTYPVFVAFIEPLIFKEKFKPSNILLAAVMLFGLFITIPSASFENSMTLGILWGMISSASYAALSLLNRYLSEKYTSQKVCFYEQSIACIAMLPVIFISKPVFKPTDVFLIIVLGVLCTAVAQALFVESLKNVKATTAGIVSGMESVYGILLALLILREVPGIREIAGGIIILSAALASSLKSRQ